MIRLLYAWLATAAAPLLRAHLHRRAASGREIARRLGERRGHDQTLRPPGRVVWLHAASVGETMSILPVIAALLERPEVVVLVTTGTVTSAELLLRRAAEMCPPGRVLHRFVPLDVPRWCRRFVAHWRPDVAGFVESELWPNLLRACHRRRVPLMLVNARMSARSAATWRRAPLLARSVLRLFDVIEAQTAADAARLAGLGARDVGSPGNLKAASPALPADPSELARLRAALGARPAWLAASTHPGEERLAAAIHVALAPSFPGLVTVIAPRHPVRGAAIADEIRAAFPEATLTRRASHEDPPAGGIWLADTLGELGLLYRLVPIVFVGRSLAVGGGQNPMEPARLGCAVAVGPRIANFAAAADDLAAAGALDRVADAAGLQDWVAAMLRDPARADAMGQAGIACTTRLSALPEQVAARLLALMAPLE